MKKNLVSLAYLQNYRRLNIVSCAISTNPNPHFWQNWQEISSTRCRIPDMQVFYTMLHSRTAAFTSQAPGDATVLKWFFRDNFVTFRRRSKRIEFLESVNFSTCVNMQKLSIFVMVAGPLFDFLAPFKSLYLPNAWLHTLQTTKIHTFRVSAFHRYHWFGVKLFPVGCAQDSRRVP